MGIMIQGKKELLLYWLKSGILDLRRHSTCKANRGKPQFPSLYFTRVMSANCAIRFIVHFGQFTFIIDAQFTLTFNLLIVKIRLFTQLFL